MGQDAAADLTRQLDRVDLLRRRIINVVGHELKLPVSTIRGLAQALHRATPEQIQAEIGPALVRSSARLERLVDDLLLASGVFTVLPVEPPMPKPVAAAIERAWSDAAGDGAPEITGERDASVSVRADTLDRILAAVVDNAVKYGTPPISFDLHHAGDRVVLDVRSGGTLGADDMALATEPFFRGEAAVTAAPGLGIGLAVAHALAAQDGGRVGLRADGDTIVATVELPST